MEIASKGDVMVNLISKEEFIVKYNIEDEVYEKANIKWSEMEELFTDYIRIKDNLIPIAKSIVEVLMVLPTVHSVRYRIKNPEHLIEKVIRKRSNDAKRIINRKNYLEEITDLIGIRVLHLFKEEWEGIHDYITEEWDLKEIPQANIREGDSKAIIKAYEQKGCHISVHKAGYRSVHYLILSNLTKKQYAAEIQVRTLFEEAWSEIDHKIRYPYNIDNEILSSYLEMFNRLAGSADEMGSYINFLRNDLKEREVGYINELKEKESIIAKLMVENDKLYKRNQSLVKAKKENDKKNDIETIKINNLDKTIGVKEIRCYLETSQNVRKLNQCAISAGFSKEEELKDKDEERLELLDFIRYLSQAKLIYIEELDCFLEESLEYAEDYYKKQKEKSNGSWMTSETFNIILLILLKYSNEFSLDLLAVEFGWDYLIANRVVSVIKEWKKDKH